MDKPPATLLERLRDPGFTPRLREVDGLVDLLADEDLAKAAARAIARVGPAALGPLRARLEAAAPPLRAHVVHAIGRFAPEPAAVDVLLAALEDADPKTRRNAAIALGHVARPDVEDALLATWDRDPRPPMRRTIATSLGKIGSARSLPVLRERRSPATNGCSRSIRKIVPAHVRHARSAVELAHVPAEDAEPRAVAELIAGFEQHLHADADAEKRLAGRHDGAARPDRGPRSRNASIVAPNAPSPGKIAASAAATASASSVKSKATPRRSSAATSEPMFPPP